MTKGSVGFVQAAKTQLQEALGLIYDNNYSAYLGDTLTAPRTVNMEYPEREEDWPGVFIQTNFTTHQWIGLDEGDQDLYPTTLSPTLSGIDVVDTDPDLTGIDLDVTDYDPDVTDTVTRYRRGYFEGQFLLTVLALHNEERDRIYDSLIWLLTAGRLDPQFKRFYDHMAGLDGTDTLCAMTVLEGKPIPRGESAGVGTPWGSEDMTYERSLAFQVVGQWYFDPYNRTLLRLSQVGLRGVTEPEPLPAGSWTVWEV